MKKLLLYWWLVIGMLGNANLLASSIIVTNTNSAGAGSFQNAVNLAFNDPSPNTIRFDLPPGSIIYPTGQIWMQGGGDAIDGQLIGTQERIIFDGANFNLGEAWALIVNCSSCAVQNVEMRNFSYTAIGVWEVSDVLIRRNVLYGNKTGIQVDGGAQNVSVESNIIGVDANMVNDQPEDAEDYGIWIGEAYDVFIAGNVVSGLGEADGGNVGVNMGIVMDTDDVGSGITVTNNLIGVDQSGFNALANHIGVWVGSNKSDVEIRNNILSGNKDSGLVISGTNVSAYDNNIGYDITGQGALPSDTTGIWIGDDASNISIYRNQIAGNSISTWGIYCQNTTNVSLGTDNGIDKNVITGCNVGIGLLYNGATDFGVNELTCNNLPIWFQSQDGMPAPEITDANSGTIQGTASASTTVDVYAHDDSECNNAPCQGREFLGRTQADIQGNWSLSGLNLQLGTEVTAIATSGPSLSSYATCGAVSGAPAFCDLSDVLCESWVQSYVEANYTCNDGQCGSINLYTSPQGECVVDFVGEQPCLLNACPSHEVFDLDGNLLESYGSVCGLEGLGYTGWQQVWSCGQAVCPQPVECPGIDDLLCLDWLQQSPLGEEGISYNEQEEVVILINFAAGGGSWYSFFDCSGQLLQECAGNNINDPSVNCDAYYNSLVQNAMELLGPLEPLPDCTGTGNDCFQVSANIVQPSCPDQDNGVITTTIFGGIPPYSYQWSTGADTPNLTGLSPGSYTLTVTDATGCARSTFVDISQKGGDAIALPDGTGASYESTISFSQFPQGAIVQNTSDIVYAKLDLEHSYSGDLDIELICPSGASVHLLDYPSGTGSANLGEPFASGAVDMVSNDLTQGIPYTYTFVNTAPLGTLPQFAAGAPTYTYTTVISEQTGQSYSYTDTYFPSGDYEPVDSYAGLVGCPLNGDWAIRVTDNLAQDNGWLFGWSLGLSTGQQSASVTLNDIPCNDGAYFLEASTYSIEPGETVLLSYGANPLGDNNVLHFGNGQSTPLQDTEGAIEVEFENPGVYRPYIRIDGQTVAQVTIQVRSCGWFGYVRSNNNYREANEDLCDLVIGDGRMYLAPALSDQFYYWTSYENIRDFPVQGDAAILEARIKVPQNEGGIGCYDPQITIYGTEGRATARWMQPNCSYYSGIGAGSTYLAGSSTDLEALTADFSQWRILKIELEGQTISAFIDDELRYQVAYEGEVGNVVGLGFTAKGSSSLDWIRLYQGQSVLVYEENFDDCGLNDDEPCNTSPWIPQACASGNTHFINVIYEELESEISGQPLQEGDWLGLFYEQDDGTLVCMDQAQFADPAQENGFLLRGCEESSPGADDGFAPDEPFQFKVFKDGVEYSSSALSVAFWAEGGIIPPIFPDATSRFIGDGRQSAIRSIRDFPDIEDPSCDTPIPISCGQSLTGNNTDGTDNALSYNCFTNVVDGPEVIYAFALDQTSDVLITLGALSDDLELLLLDECDRDHCIAVSERTGPSAETILKEGLAPGEYIIVVEGYIGFESSYTLSLDCGDFQQGGFSCTPEEISCNESINATTANGCGDVNFYNCAGSYTPGREKVYRIRFDQPENVRITLTPQGGDLELFLLDALNPDRCIYYSTESGDEVERILLDDSEVIPNRDYYIVVDEYGGDEGIGFQLQVDCIPDGPPCPWCPPPPGFCDNAEEVACGSTVSGHTENGVSRVEKWGDCPSFNVGPELIYVFNNPVAQDVQINLSGFSENLNFYVLRDQCAVSACYEGWAGNKSGLIAESILITPMPAGEYYIVVDSYDAPSAFDLEIKCQEADNCFQLQVPVGYSYISSNRRPGDPTIENVLPTGQFQGMSLLLLDEWGNVYDPNFPTPNAPNKISAWDVTHGYRIDVTEEVALEFCGEEADPQAIRDVYVLNQGGDFHNNIIAYPFQEPMPVAEAFAGAPSDVLSTIEHIYPNQASPSETYNLQFQFGINFDMAPGVGYRLKVAEDGGFSYRDQDEPSHFVSNGCTYFQTPLRNTMERAFIRVPQQAVSALMQPGDELGLFNEAGLLCGSGKYLGEQLIIVLLGDDPATASREGFTAGEWMYGQTWSAATGATQHIALQFSGSEPIYVPNFQYWLEGLSSASGTRAAAPLNWHLYPNPVGKRLSVECQLPAAQRVAVRLIGVDGQVLSQEEWFLDEGLNQRLIRLAQLPDGVYFVQIAGEGFTEAKKIVVQH